MYKYICVCMCSVSKSDVKKRLKMEFISNITSHLNGITFTGRKMNMTTNSSSLVTNSSFCVSDLFIYSFVMYMRV